MLVESERTPLRRSGFRCCLAKPAAVAALLAVGMPIAACGSSSSGSTPPGGSGGSGPSSGGTAAGGDSAGADSGAPGGAGGTAESGAAGSAGTDGVIDTGLISTPSTGFGESESSVAVAPDGRIAVAWIAFSAVPSIGYTMSLDGGRTFAKPSYISPGTGRTTSDPVLAVDAQGALRLAWLEAQCTSSTTCSDGHVFVARAPAGSVSFDTPVDVTDADPSAYYDKPWLAKTGQGTLIASYARITSAGSSIVVSRNTGGQTWSRSTVFSAPLGDRVGVPHMCVDPQGTRVWVVYTDLAMPTYTSIRWSDDDGATWPAANVHQVGLSSEGAQVQSYDAKCVGHGDDVWVLYSLSSELATATKLGKYQHIQLAHSADRGATFDPPISVNDAAAAQYYLRPEIVRESGGAIDIGYYAGNQDDDPNGSFRFARRPATSRSFGPTQVVHAPLLFTTTRSTAAWIGDYSGFAVTGGNLYVSYCDNSSGTSHVAFWRSGAHSP